MNEKPIKLYKENPSALNNTQDNSPEKTINNSNNDSDEKISITEELNIEERPKKNSCCHCLLNCFCHVS